MRIHRVYCKSVSGHNKRFAIDESQSNHLIKALRLKEDSIIEVFDGNGNSASCKIINFSKKTCEVERINNIKHDLKPKRLLTTIVPFIKKNNFNFMIQKLAEIGVNKFIIYKPDLIDQSVAKKDLKRIIKKSHEIVINVSKQCGNNHLPSIEESESLNEAITLVEDKSDIFIFDTDASEYFIQDEINKKSSVIIITGPESGFSETEIKLKSIKNAKQRHLGQNILRAETAPIYISSLIKNQFGKIS